MLLACTTGERQVTPLKQSKNLPVQQQVILTKGISVRAALGSETEIGNFQSEGGLDYLLNKSGRDVIWGNFKNYEKFNSQKPQGETEKKLLQPRYTTEAACRKYGRKRLMA